MKRAFTASVTMLVALLAVSATAQAADRLEVYKAKVSRAKLGALSELGIDRNETQFKGSRAAGKIRIELILSGAQARALRREGIALSVKKVRGKSATARANAAIAQQMEVFRPYSGAGGIREEFEQVARATTRRSRSSSTTARPSRASRSSP